MTGEPTPKAIPEVSASGANRWIQQATAPFRGYGMERIPGLRTLYRKAYARLAEDRLHELVLPSMRLLVDLRDTSIVPSLRFTKSYEATFSRAIDSLLLPGDTVVDVGAHVGYHAVRMAQIVGPTGKIYAYEPEPELRHLLTLNLLRNSVAEWSTVYTEAVGSDQQNGKLWRNGSNTGGASLIELCVDEISSCEPVNVVDLDHHLDTLSAAALPIGLIKVDVQGCEFAVIEGAAGILNDQRPILAFEYNPTQLTVAGCEPITALSALVAQGYELFAANEYDRSVRHLGSDAIHAWCISEKPDGSGGFLNLIAVHVDRKGSLPWTTD